MNTRLLLRPVNEVNILEVRLTDSGFVEFRTDEPLDVNIQAISVSVSFQETFSLFVTSINGEWYQTNTLWPENVNLPSNLTIVNQLVYEAATGEADATFNIGTGFNNSVDCLIVDHLGRLVCGGAFTQYNGVSVNRLVRLLEDGSIDTTFNVGTGLSNVPRTIIQWSDNSYVVGGAFLQYNGVTTNQIIWLEEDGSTRPSFVCQAFSGVNNQVVYGLAQMADNNLLAVGSFNTYGAVTYNGVMKLTPTGVITPGWSNLGGFGGSADYAYSCCALENGRAYIGGQFTLFAGTAANKIIRITSNGIRESVFAVSVAPNSNVLSIYQLNGTTDILVCGLFTTIGGFTRRGIAKLDEFGVVLPFVVPINSNVTSAAFQADQSMYIAGGFTQYGADSVNGLCRLLPESSTQDIDLNIGTGFGGGTSRRVAIDQLGRPIIFGNFTSYQGDSWNRICRLSANRYSLLSDVVDVDLREDLQFPLTFTISDITSPETRKSNFSKSISLPGTKKNSKIFSQLFDISVDSTYNVNKKVRVTVIQDGLEILNGNLRLDNISDTDKLIAYNVSIDGELSNIFSKLKNQGGSDLLISDIDFSDYSHTPDYNTVVNSWNGIITKNGAPYTNADVVYSCSVSDTVFVSGNFTAFVIGATASANFKVGDVVRFIMDSPGDPLVNFDESNGDHTIIGFVDAGGNSVPPTDPTCVGPVVNLSFKSGDTNSGTLELRENTGEGYVYPITYGGTNTATQSVIGWTFTKLTTYVYVKDIIDRVFKNIGYTYTSEFFNSQIFKRLIINSETVANLDRFSISCGEVSSTSYVVTRTTDTSYNITSTLSSSPDFVRFQTEVLNAYGGSHFIGSYLAGAGNYRITLCNYSILAPGNIGATWRIGIWSLSQNGFIAATNVTQTSSTTTFELAWDVVLTQVNTDDLRLVVQSTEGLNITVFQGGGSTLAFDDYPTQNIVLPSISFNKFFVSILNAFNLYLEYDSTLTNNVIIETFDTYYRGNIVDWTNKVDIGKEIVIKPISPFTSKSYIFTYSSDSDFYNTKYTSNNAEIYGTETIDVPTDFTDSTTTVQLLFAPTPLVDLNDITSGDIPYRALVIPSIVKDALDAPVSKVKTRLLYWTGVRYVEAISFGLDSTGTATTYNLPTYGYAGHLDNPFNATLDLNFGLVNEYFYGNTFDFRVTQNTLYSKYYEDYLSELTSSDARLVTMYIKLNSYDITTLSFRRLYWIRGVLYRLQRISDYNPLTSAPTLCEFIKVKVNEGIE